MGAFSKTGLHFMARLDIIKPEMHTDAIAGSSASGTACYSESKHMEEEPEMKLHRVRDFLAGALTMALVAGLAVPAGAALSSKTIQVLTGADIYIDGVEMKPTDANGNPVETFVYNGTTYVPLRAVSEYLGENVQWDGANQRVYIGETPGAKQYLNTVCPPYQSHKYETPTTVSMAGQTYANAIRLGGWYSSGWALYNLNGQYSTLRFTVGHIDDADMHPAELNIYLDDTLALSMELDPEAMPEALELPLNSALQMKIEITDSGFALGEVEIS